MFEVFAAEFLNMNIREVGYKVPCSRGKYFYW